MNKARFVLVFFLAIFGLAGKAVAAPIYYSFETNVIYGDNLSTMGYAVGDDISLTVLFDPDDIQGSTFVFPDIVDFFNVTVVSGSNLFRDLDYYNSVGGRGSIGFTTDTYTSLLHQGIGETQWDLYADLPLDQWVLGTEVRLFEEIETAFFYMASGTLTVISDTAPVVHVPEPETWLLLVMGFTAMILFRNKYKI